MILLRKISEFFEENNNLKSYLLLANIFLVASGVILFNLGSLPFIHIGDFVFLVFIVFLFSLYRPGWTFLLFTGFIVIETVILSPEEIGIALRPYQALGALGILAVIIRFYSGRLNFRIPKFLWYDWVIVLFSASGFVSALMADNKNLALKESLIIFSFVVLYFFSRIFVQNLKDIKRILPFFLGSSFIVLIYSIWQNWRFLCDKNSFEVMPGRPNGTFTEADWLGMFLVFLLSVLLVVAYDFYKKINLDELRYQAEEFGKAIFIWVMMTLSFAVLIITVSRSAWLGAGIVLIVFTFLILKDKNYKILGLVFSSILLGLGIVYVFGLTNFELENRFQSTGSGKQEITISCDSSSNIPKSIVNVLELEKFNCVHIDLEDIEKEKNLGRVVTKVYRDDPNVSIRSEIYKKSWEEIKKSPVFGIGWGNIQDILGADDRGAGLNSSNIFLEVWLGAGIIGLISFLVVLGNIFYRSISILFGNNFNSILNNIIFKKREKNQDLNNLKLGNYNFNQNSKFKIQNSETWGLFLILSFFAIIIPNLFNAGIMLGFIWMWLAVSQIRE